MTWPLCWGWSLCAMWTVETGAEHLGAATWKGMEATHCDFPWPYMFNQIIDEYDARHGIDCDHLKTIAKINFDNGRRNPNAQSRNWQFRARELHR